MSSNHHSLDDLLVASGREEVSLDSRHRYALRRALLQSRFFASNKFAARILLLCRFHARVILASTAALAVLVFLFSSTPSIPSTTSAPSLTRESANAPMVNYAEATGLYGILEI